jgi:hypothetical protein
MYIYKLPSCGSLSFLKEGRSCYVTINEQNRPCETSASPSPAMFLNIPLYIYKNLSRPFTIFGMVEPPLYIYVVTKRCHPTHEVSSLSHSLKHISFG